MNFPANAVERLLAGRVRLLTLPQAEKVEGLVSRRARKWLRGSRRYEGLAAYRLPSALVVPIIEDAYERDGIYAVEGIVGLPQRTLFRIAHDSSGVEFQTTDRIVTALLGAEAWQEEPLRGWYFSHASVMTREPC